MLPPCPFPTLGDQVAAWMETHLCHGPGDVEGDDWEIDDEFVRFLQWTYCVWPKGHREAGRRLVQRAILSRPKGRAKSEFAGGITCAEAMGPVRFSRWAQEGETAPWGYPYEPGEPVGKPVTSPFIRCLATEEDQAGNTYDNVRVMLVRGAISDGFGLREGREVGLSRTFVPGGGEIRPSTSGDASKDGGLETFAVADESHLYVDQRLRRMYGTVARNTGKRKIAEPWMLDTTTAFAPGEHSVAEQAAERYAHLEVLEGVQRYGVLYDHAQGDVPRRFGDDRSLIKAMKPGYGPAAAWMDFPRIVRIVRDSEDPEAEFYRYWLNRARKASSHWLAPDEITALLEPFEVPARAPVALGFDGSENDDHTVLWLCTKAGDLAPIGIWTPAGEDLGWREDVTRAVNWAFEHFHVVRAYFDPAYWSHELAGWADKHGSPPIAEFWTSGRSEAKFGIACGAARTSIRHGDCKISPRPLLTDDQQIDGRGLVQWHLENARIRKIRVRRDDSDRTEDAYVVRKDRPGSQHKIDSAVGVVLARKARDDALKAGEFQQADYGTASWGGVLERPRVGVARQPNRSDYRPCRGCGKPIHPALHEPDAAERGLCTKCRARGLRLDEEVSVGGRPD